MLSQTRAKAVAVIPEVVFRALADGKTMLQRLEHEGIIERQHLNRNHGVQRAMPVNHR